MGGLAKPVVLIYKMELLGFFPFFSRRERRFGGAPGKVAYREKENSEFAVKELRKEDISRLVREHPPLAALHQRLVDLVKNRRGGFSFLEEYET